MKTYLIKQKITPLINRYAIYEAAPGALDGQEGPMVAFAEQKRFAFKEKFNVFSGEDKQQVNFTIQARQVLDFGARYDVADAAGNLLGTIGKDFKSSLLRSTWHIFRPGQEEVPALIIQERSKGLAIVRRLWELLPYINDIPFFVKYQFDFTDPATGQITATYDKITTFRDHYRLVINDETTAPVDVRVFIALGVMMDALQSR